MYIYIVRHGFTLWNGDGKLQGKQDTELSDIGRTQGRILGERLKSVPIKKIYSSPLKRAYETASIINSFLKVPIECKDGLMEMSFGDWEGSTWDYIKNNHPHFPTWNKDRFVCKTPNGESYKDTLDRALSTLKEICSNNDEDSNILIVSHGALIKTLICGILNLDIHNGNKLLFDNCGITVLEFTENHFFIKTLNDLSHFPNQ